MATQSGTPKSATSGSITQIIGDVFIIEQWLTGGATRADALKSFADLLGQAQTIIGDLAASVVPAPKGALAACPAPACLSCPCTPDDVCSALKAVRVACEAQRATGMTAPVEGKLADILKNLLTNIPWAQLIALLIHV